MVVDEAHHGFIKATEAVKFYRDIMRPDFTLLITATPDDADVEVFKKAAGLAVLHRIQVSRQHAVDAGLIKEAVKSVAYLVADEQKELVNLQAAALEDGWRTHQLIKARLLESNIRVTPLMLVQVGNTGKAGESAITEAKQHLLNLGAAEEAIAWYTADEPNDDLLAVARGETKEVLIFKVAVALGFDAPRAFTLVSLRGAKSTDFGIQVVGRILRVHQRLRAMAISKALPDLLRFGYVFLADSESQSGLINAGSKINAITTQLSEITPYTMVVKFAGQSEVQVSSNGQLSLLPQDLNTTERQFAQLLDADTSGAVLWWHRNEASKPWSVGIVMPIGDRYFPDFIIGVKDRNHGDGILLVETKGGHIINSDNTLDKIRAEHKQYGKPLMLSPQEDGRFWMMRYIESSQKIEPDQVFRVENMRQC